MKIIELNKKLTDIEEQLTNDGDIVFYVHFSREDDRYDAFTIGNKLDVLDASIILEGILRMFPDQKEVLKTMMQDV